MRHRLGIRAFGVSAWTGSEAGDRIINEHDEADDEQEELYLVRRAERRSRSTASGVEAPAGTFVFVRPGVKRTAFAEEPGTTIVAVGAVPGKAYEPTRLRASGRRSKALYEAGRLRGRPIGAARSIEAHPSTPTLMYNLACCESLAGRKDDAIGHLGWSIERLGAVPLRTRMANDSDFDPIRDEPAFKELVGAS